MTPELTVPVVNIGPKLFYCPICYANVTCYVDRSAAEFEEVPERMELHLQWHDRNDR